VEEVPFESKLSGGMFYLLQHSTYPLKSVELDFDHSNRLMGFASGFFVHAD